MVCSRSKEVNMVAAKTLMLKLQSSKVVDNIAGTTAIFYVQSSS